MSLSVSYLKYLRDVSRKLVLRAGFDKVFPGTSRSPDCLSVISEEREKVWFTHAAAEEAKAERAIFLGLGVVTGTLTSNRRTKKLAAPLFVAQAAIDVEHSKIRLRPETLSLNYDLVQHLVDFNITPEDETELVEHDTDLQRLFLLLDDITNRITSFHLPREIGKEGTENSKDEDDVRRVGRIMIHGLQTINPGLRIEEAVPPYSMASLKKRAKDKDLLVSYERILFAGRFPDQLSTYIALQKLIDQLEQGGISNPLIDGMIRGALERDNTPIHHSHVPDEEIRQAIKLLPLTLSERQKEAVYNAWQNPISYIQGPPGTGKSHTIAAMMLTALSMDKKVLLISQKKAAIKVVKEKLATLSGGSESLVFISSDPEVKSHLRLRLEGIIQEAQQDRRDHRRLEREREMNDALRLKVNSIRKQLHDLRKKIQGMVEVQREFFESNKEFLRLRDDCVSTFRIEEGFRFHLIGDNNKNKWETRLQEVRAILSKPIPTRKDILFLKATKKISIELIGADSNSMDIRNPGFELYLSRLSDCTVAYSKSMALQSRTAEAEEINTYRETYARDLKAVEKQQQLFIASTQRLRWRMALTNHDEIDNLSKFRAMLRNIDPNLIEAQMKVLDYEHLTRALPLWAGLIRDLGNYLRFDPQLFDLVIVDESSQVNIAEVLPAFYRARQICVVGDKKQLGLNAAGLFALNRKYEEMSWMRHFSHNYSFLNADNMGLVVSKHSILEFITNPNSINQPPSSTLNEHFRSAPKLAEFTSKKFYEEEGGLKIMTMVGEKVTRPCFQAIHVPASREPKSRMVLSEIAEAIKIVKGLVEDETWRTDPLLRGHFSNGIRPSIGVLSFTTDQNAEVRDRLDELDEEKRGQYSIFCGTTEEFQGNERNIMILLPAVDEFLTSAQFYNDARRMNVATSRAINFTYLIYGGIPANFRLLDSYLRFFNVAPEDLNRPLHLMEKYYNWKFDAERLASEFEIRVCDYLQTFLSTEYPTKLLALFNQVQSCGKFLDFVIFNPATSKAFAIEVDGPDHYLENELDYTSTHLDREALLRRAGWEILHIPYYKWYSHGWLADANPSLFERNQDKLLTELRRLIAKTSA